MSDPILPPPIPTNDKPQPKHAQYKFVNGEVVAYGYFPNGSPDPDNLGIVALTDGEYAKLFLPGTKITDADGHITVTPLPPPPPVQLGSVLVEDKFVTTTDATPTELARFALAVTTMYTAHFQLWGIDNGPSAGGASNGNRRYLEAKVVAVRLSNGAIIDNTTVLVNSFNNATAQAWAASASPIGNVVAIMVTGQVGRKIDWILTTSVKQARPSGLA